MADLDASLGPSAVQIPSIRYEYVNRRSEKEPFIWFAQFANPATADLLGLGEAR